MSKKTFKIYKLKFISPLHLSRGKDGDDYSKTDKYLHSDTLKSAVFSIAVLLNPDLHDEKKGAEFFNSFLVSSTFPYYKDTLFLPKPKGKIPFTDIPNEEASYDYKKDLKKLNYIDFDLFFEFFKNKSNEVIVKNNDKFEIASGFMLKPTLFIGEKVEKRKSCLKKSFSISNTEVQERVYIRKYHETYDEGSEKPVFSDPYIVEKIHFKENSGLYFFVEISENFDLGFFDKVLKNLGEFGVGTDRNVGNGQFIYEKCNDIEIEYSENSEFVLNLALFLPTEQDVENFTPNCQYKLIKRGGWISNVYDLELLNKTITETSNTKINRTKKSVYMIDEASVFENKFNFNGKVVDLNPENNNINHPVWRDGRAVFIPINNVKI